MKSYSLSHLADHVLRRELLEAAAQDRASTAALLARIAEFDARRLYAPAGYPSMYHYCVGELRLSEDAALRRLRAARTARQFPAIFPALAAGRLHMTAVLVLTPYLTAANAGELLAAAANKKKSGLELLLAERFPRPDVPAFVQAISPPRSEAPPAAAPVGAAAGPAPAQPPGACAVPPVPTLAPPAAGPTGPLALAPVDVHEASRTALAVAPPPPRGRLAPLSPGRFAMQLTIAQDTHEKLRYAQALLGHALPSGDLSQVLDRALDALIHELEKRKFAPASRTRPTSRRRRASNPRYVPTAVRRAVWQRDGGQCTFVNEKGHRCEARTRLEYDHVEPVARGGQATTEGIRLRCRAHNQYDAERLFGAGFMDRARQEARSRVARRRATVHTREAPRARDA